MIKSVLTRQDLFGSNNICHMWFQWEECANLDKFGANDKTIFADSKSMTPQTSSYVSVKHASHSPVNSSQGRSAANSRNSDAISRIAAGRKSKKVSTHPAHRRTKSGIKPLSSSFGQALFVSISEMCVWVTNSSVD